MEKYVSTEGAILYLDAAKRWLQPETAPDEEKRDEALIVAEAKGAAGHGELSALSAKQATSSSDHQAAQDVSSERENISIHYLRRIVGPAGSRQL